MSDWIGRKMKLHKNFGVYVFNLQFQCFFLGSQMFNSFNCGMKIQIEENNWLRNFKGSCWKAPDGIIGVTNPHTFTGTNAWTFTYIITSTWLLCWKKKFPSTKTSPMSFRFQSWSFRFQSCTGVYEDSTSARMGWCWTPEIQVVWVSQDGFAD